MVTCSAFRCSNRGDRKPKSEENQGVRSKITFHRFPKDPERRKDWIRALRREDWQPSYASVLCSEHFEESCFDRTSVNITRLREHSVPTIFSAFPPHQVILSRKMEKDQVLDKENLFDCSDEIEAYNCKTCSDFQTNLLVLFKAHVRNGHRNEISNEDFYKCLNCFFISYSKYVIGQHSFFSECATSDEHEREKRFVHYRNGQPESDLRLEDVLEISFHKEREDINGFKSEQCLTQSKSKPNESHLKSGQSSSGDKYWDLQQYTYKSTDTYLEGHMKFRRSRPQDIQWFNCQDCSSKFKRRGHLRAHVMARHSKPEEIEWLTCQHCSVKFKEKGNLNRHIITCHSKPEDIQWFTCHLCPSKFKRNGYLKSHITSVHSKPEEIQWFECEQCSSKFKLKHQLKQHIIRRHSKPEDVQWFKCEQCPSRFNQNSNLRKHIKSLHSKPEDIQWFTCHHCSLKFKERGILKRHLINRHFKHGDIQ